MSATTETRHRSPAPSGSAGRSQPPESKPQIAVGPPPSAKPFIGLLGALAVLAGAASLTIILSGPEWIPPVLQVVGLVWLIGFGSRLMRWPSPVTVLLQAFGIALTLTSLFTDGGIWGMIPNKEAVAEAGTLLSNAWVQIQETTPPAQATPELGLLIAIALALVALIVDFLVCEVDAPALVALPLLCLYSVPASIADELLPWWTFALPALAYAALVAVAGHPGRRVGLRAGFGIAAVGTVATVAAIALSLFVADSITAISTEGRIPRGNSSSSGGDIGLSPFTSLKGDLQRSEAVDVLRVAGLLQPDYLRTIGLEQWTAGQGFSEGALASDSVAIDGELDMDPLARNPAAEVGLVQVTNLAFSDRYVPIYQGTQSVSGLPAGWKYNPTLGSIYRPDAASPGSYAMLVNSGVIPPEDLRADTVTPGGLLTEQAGVPLAVVSQAQEITAAGKTAFDKALLLKDFFTTPANGFQYTLSVPEGNSGDALVDFLQNKQGYCEQYATAMTIMLRTLDIPARVAIGFTQGQANGNGEYTISSHDAHAWVEVKFDKAGWVRFDPTPLGVAEGGQQGFDNPSTSAEPTPSAPSGTGGLNPEAGDDFPQDGGITQTNTVTSTEISDQAVGVGSDGFRGFSAGEWAALGGIVFLALLLISPSVYRRRRTKRRIALASAGGPGAAAAAWSEVEDLALDHGLSPDRKATVRVAANYLAKHGKLTADSRAGLRRIALATEHSWYSGSDYLPPEGTDLGADVQHVNTEFAQTAPLTLLDRVLPRSIRPGAKE